MSAFGACGSEREGSNYGSCIDLDSVESPSGDPPIDLPDGVKVTHVAQRKGFMVVTAVAEGSVDTYYVPMESVLTSEGFEIVRRDNEGFEAELFFAKGDTAAGAIRMRVGPCPEQITFSILFDPLETKAGRAALEEARRNWLRGRAAASPTPSP